MGEVEKSTQNGTRRKDKYRTRQTPKRETDNNHLPPRNQWKNNLLTTRHRQWIGKDSQDAVRQ